MPQDFRLADLTGDGRLDVVAVVAPSDSGYSQTPSTVRVFGVVDQRRPCNSDLNLDFSVNAADLSILLAAWGTNGQAEFDTDIDGSGHVDGGDLALILSGWGPCPQ